MAIDRAPHAWQEKMLIAASAVHALGNPFCAALDNLLRKSGLDEFAEETRWDSYMCRMGHSRAFLQARTFRLVSRE